VLGCSRQLGRAVWWPCVGVGESPAIDAASIPDYHRPLPSGDRDRCYEAFAPDALEAGNRRDHFRFDPAESRAEEINIDIPACEAEIPSLGAPASVFTT